MTGWQYEYVYNSFSELLQKRKDGEIDLFGLLYRDFWFFAAVWFFNSDAIMSTTFILLHPHDRAHAALTSNHRVNRSMEKELDAAHSAASGSFFFAV